MWHEELYSVWHNIWESLRTRAWIPGLDQSSTSSVRADRCIFQTKPDVTCFAPSWLPLLHWAGPITTAAHRLRLVCPLRCLLISLSLQICFLAVGFWWESCHCCRPGNNNAVLSEMSLFSHTNCGTYVWMRGKKTTRQTKFAFGAAGLCMSAACVMPDLKHFYNTC